MMVKSSSRLNVIFTVWFLAVAVIPSLFVGAFSYSLQKKQMRQAVQRELALVGRLKLDLLNQYAVYAVSTLHAIATKFSGDEAGLRKFLDGLIAQKANPLYLVEPLGTKSYPPLAGNDWSVAWLATASHSSPQMRVVASRLYFAYPRPASSEWLVYRTSPDLLGAILHQDINDTRFFSRNRLAGADDDVGRTADVFLLDSEGLPLGDSIMLGDIDITRTPHEALAQWIRGSRDSVIDATTDLAGTPILLHARRSQILGQAVVLVSTINNAEVVSRIYDKQRDLIVAYLLAMAGILFVLYLFVRSISRIVVRPINASIVDLVKSSEKIKESIGTTEHIMATQVKVAESLSRNYRGQVQHIRAVDREIATISTSLADISKQTKAAAKNVQLIDSLAVQSQKEAQEARVGLQSIKRLTTAHEVLSQSLNRYSAQVDRIAAQVRKLAHATKYLSLNATIEANREPGSHSLSSIVSEVGRLSLLSRDASVQINELIRSIQTQLRESRETSAHEREEAQTSLSVVNRALLSLNKMSRDIMKIGASVRVIDRQVTRESESTKAIASHSNELTDEAKRTLKDAAKIDELTVQQKQSVRTNSLAVGKLLLIIHKLRELIGMRK